MGDMSFDRSASDELIDMLRHGTPRAMVELVRNQPATRPLYDLQLRRDPKGNNPRSWATLYYGMTALINIEERQGKYRLTAHPKYRAIAQWDDGWKGWHERGEIEAAWSDVADYLEAIKGQVAESAVSKEGPVHAAISSGASDAYRVINREASPSFRDKPTRQARLAAWVEPFNHTLEQREGPPPWWPRQVKVGNSLDFLAVDIGGRLALVEAKADTASAKELAKVAVQAGVYAAMFADLLREQPETVDAIAHMLRQRTQLKLTRRGILHLREQGRVVPVIAIGPGRPSTEVHRRMWEVAEAVSDVNDPHRVDPVEVWYLDRAGHITEVERPADVRARARR